MVPGVREIFWRVHTPVFHMPLVFLFWLPFVHIANLATITARLRMSSVCCLLIYWRLFLIVLDRQSARRSVRQGTLDDLPASLWAIQNLNSESDFQMLIKLAVTNRCSGTSDSCSLSRQCHVMFVWLFCYSRDSTIGTCFCTLRRNCCNVTSPPIRVLF